jgi:hypothetical protein
MRAVVAGLVLSLLPAAALARGRAAGCELGDYDPVRRPDPEGMPTEVGIGVYFVQLDRVDNVDESFRLDGFFTLAWRDERLAAAVKAADRQQCRLALEQVWEPHVVILNRRDTSLELPDVVTVDTNGSVHYVQRVQSTLLAPMDLQDFPMDRQTLPLTFLSHEYGPESVTLSFDETAASRETDLTIPGWEIEELFRRGGTLEVKAPKSGAGDRLFARFDYEFRVHRAIDYYVWPVIGPLTFAVLHLVLGTM